MQVNIKQGYFSTTRKFGRGQDNIKTLQDALSLQAECSPCGCDECLGFWTQINATTGELMAVYITGTDPYELVIEPYATALVNLKALKAARDAS